MARSLSEIADLIEQAAEGLGMLGEGIAGPGNAGKRAAQLFGRDGMPINLDELADDIRQHAAGLSNT